MSKEIFDAEDCLEIVNPTEEQQPKKYEKMNQKKYKVPKGTELSKRIRILIWVAIVLISLSGVLAFLKSEKALDIVQNVEKEINSFLENIEENEQASLYSFQLESFINDFVPLYMNVSNNNEKFTKQQEELQKYYSDEIEVVPTVPVGTRTLNSSEFYDVQEENGVITVSVLVNYTSSAPAVELVTVDSMLNIPVVETEKNEYVVVEQPYFTAIPDNIGVVEETAKVVDPYEMETQVTSEVADEVNTFLNEFYKLYASSTTEEMQYMMAEPEGLAGTYEFVSHTSQVYESIENPGNLIVKSQVVFKEINSDVKHTENMTLELSFIDDMYHVETMDHTLGGESLE